MNGDSVVAFCQPAGKPRWRARNTCNSLAELPPAVTCWASRALNVTRTGNTPEPRPKPKKEAWRTTPSLPGSQNLQPKPKRPSEMSPDMLPTRGHILFPWEADMTEIEWVVTTFLQKEHPEIFDQIIRLALERSGLVYPRSDREGDIR